MPYKATLPQTLEALKAAGVDIEIVDNETDSTYDIDSVLSSIDDNRGKILKPKIAEELEQGAWEKATGKYGGLLRNKLCKETGIPISQLTKIEKDEDAIKAAIAYMNDNIQGEAAEVKKKFDEITTQHQKEIDELKSQHETALSAEKNIRIKRDSLDYIKKEVLKDIPLPDGADRDIIAEDYYNSLTNRYGVTYDENGKKIDLYQKEKPSFPAMKDGTTQPILLAEDAKGFLSVRGMVKKDMRDVNPADAMKNANAQPYNNNVPKQPVTPLKGDVIAQRNAERAKHYEKEGLV